MAEGEDTIDMQDTPQGEGSTKAEQNESRLRWRKRDDAKTSASKADQHAATAETEDASSTAQGGFSTLNDEQRTLVERAVQERVAAEQARTEELTTLLQRVQADFSNYKRRSEQEREQQAKFANLLLVKELLPVLDNFDRALTTIPEEVRTMPWTDGLLLVDRQLRATLEKQGLKVIEAVGNRFDPMLHEAIIHEESADHGDDEVIAELQRGYMLHDKVVRPTLVKVAKNVAHS